jgi:GTP-binding protein
MLKTGASVTIKKNNGDVVTSKVGKIFINEGISKVEVKEAQYGAIVTLQTHPDIKVGDTICDPSCVEALEPIVIEEPTLSMNFLVNSSPFAGQSGKFLTNRHIKDRLDKELQTNVGLKVEPLENSDGYKVSGRGELHLSILIEKMRREGYELSVSKPEVLYKEIDGKKYEPYENVFINVPNDYSGTVINNLNERKGKLISIENSENYTHLNFTVPTRGLIGYRSNFITNTKGEGIMVRSFDSYKPYAGKIKGRKNGVLVTMLDGKTMAYSLYTLSDRGSMIVEPACEIYKGMIIGIHNRENDLDVNPCKNKQLTNTRAAGSDDALTLITPKKFSLEEALEFIAEDEYVEVTPDKIRLRKKILDEKERYRVTREK